MSRLVDLPVEVPETDRTTAAPLSVVLPPETGGYLRRTPPAVAVVSAVRVSAVLDSWREWYGALEGEPERDVWRVRLMHGACCELHRVYRRPTSTTRKEQEEWKHDSHNPEEGAEWLLHAWLD